MKEVELELGLLLSTVEGPNAMKITITVLFILCAAVAFGQQNGAVLTNQVSILSVPDHPEHAEQHAMALEHSLIGSSDTYNYAQGERPLWEFGPVAPPPTPLGDIARAYRKEKLTAKKAEIVLNKQGS